MSATEQSLIVEFAYPFDDLSPLFELEMKLNKFIQERSLGDYDGNEMGIETDDARIYMYSTDVCVLLEAIRPILNEAPFMRNALAMMRLGPMDEPAELKEIII